MWSQITVHRNGTNYFRSKVIMFKSTCIFFLPLFLSVLAVLAGKCPFRKPSETVPLNWTSNPDTIPYKVETQKIKMSAPQIIQYEKFPLETHNVTTPDGYILTMFRIPGKKGTIPVYLMHGIFSSARDYLVQPEKDSLPFKLFDKGFDVWLGNIRGNGYSKGHTKYNSNDAAGPYWDYTVDHIIKYDHPTCIDYILKKNGQKKLIWIGHSMGTYGFFGTMALLPQYNEKILQFVGLAPFAYLGNMTSPVRLAAALADALQKGPFEPKAGQSVTGVALPAACTPTGASEICCAGVSLICGPDGFETSRRVIPVALAEFPNSVSALSARQLLKDITVPNFSMFDYTGGPGSNAQVYRSATPPLYNVKNIKAPCILYSGIVDSLVTPFDTDRIANDMPCCPRRRYLDLFNHGDFVFGRHAPDFYDYLIKDLLTILADKTGKFTAQCKAGSTSNSKPATPPKKG